MSQWTDADALDASDVDRHQRRFRSGHDVWIVQSFLLLRERLRALGHDVALRAGFPAGALCIAHWDSLNAFLSGAHRCRVIGVRADRPPLYGCDAVVVQNNVELDDRTHRFIPLWPQPGLLPRDPARGTRIETLAYFGRVEFLPAWVRGDALRDRLAVLGVALRLSEQAWNDYRDVDLVLSVRTESPLMLAFKPATKLYNAWLAGVPALLGDEPAFRALRESELDYAPIASPDDVVAAVLRLRNNPQAYGAMVARGAARGRSFTRASIGERWLALIAEIASAPSTRRSLVRHVAAIARQKMVAKRFRREHARGRAQARHGGERATAVPDIRARGE
jgi:hypothetical protein